MKRAATDFFENGFVLVSEPQLQCFFAVGIERQEIKIIVGAAMQDSAAAVNRGVDEGIGDATVLGLDVKGEVTDFDIGVVAEQHVPGCASPGNYPPAI